MRVTEMSFYQRRMKLEQRH